MEPWRIERHGRHWAVVAPSGQVAGYAASHAEATIAVSTLVAFTVGWKKKRTPAEMIVTKCGQCGRPISPSPNRPEGVLKQEVIGRCGRCYRLPSRLVDATVRKTPDGAVIITATGKRIHKTPSMADAYAWVNKYVDAA